MPLTAALDNFRGSGISRQVAFLAEVPLSWNVDHKKERATLKPHTLSSHRAAIAPPRRAGELGYQGPVPEDHSADQVPNALFTAAATKPFGNVEAEQIASKVPGCLGLRTDRVKELANRDSQEGEPQGSKREAQNPMVPFGTVDEENRNAGKLPIEETL